MVTRSTCPYCGVGCGVIATARDAGADIAGDPAHPANFGRLCSKGTALGSAARVIVGATASCMSSVMEERA